MEQQIEEFVFMARIAEQAERFDDMANFLKIVVDNKGIEMSIDERALLSVAWKNVVAAKRMTWRTIVAVSGNPKYLVYTDALNEYKAKLEQQVNDKCTTIINTIKNNILKKKTNKSIEDQKNLGITQIKVDEAKAFFYKMIADNYRYIAEMHEGKQQEQAIKDALEAYEEALKVPLKACNPIKLSICLNMSVFHFEVNNDLPKAAEVSDGALQQALQQIDELSEEQFKEAKAIIDQIKENLSNWKEDEEAKNRPLDDVEGDFLRDPMEDD